MARTKLLAPGGRAPQFRLPHLAGGEATLQDVTAKGPALVAFFKISCPVCQFTFPFLERLHVSGRMPVYGISQNDAKDTREFNREFGITFPTLLDEEAKGYVASNGFGISHVPTLFMVEPGGTVSWVLEGFSKRDLESLAGKAGVAMFRPGERVPDWKPG